MNEAIELTKLAIQLGLAVYQAVKAGDTTKTVGEIFAGVGRDMDEIKRLEDAARAQYAARAEP